MGQTIQVRRGVKANLPNLNNGELALTTDEKDLYIGTPTGNELIGGATVASQLADMAINVAGYCGTLDTITDNTLGILNAIADVKNTKQKKLVFSDGIYAYSSQLLIENVGGIHLYFSENAKLYDLCKDVPTSGGTKKVPVGVKIRNVANVTIENIKHDSNVASGSNSTVTNISDRVPHIDIDGAKNVSVIGGKLESFTGSIIGNVSVYTDSNAMTDYYLRIRKSEYVEVSHIELASNSANGEVFGFYDCDTVNWHDCSHLQADGDSTFWSFGKIIKCGDVRIGKHKIKSSSAGSFVDVIAENTDLYDLTLDYVNGKFVDISNEWGSFNMEQNKVTLRNCFSNGYGIQSTLSSDPLYNFKVKKITIDNCMFAKDKTDGNLLKLTMFETIDIKNCDPENIRYLIDGRLASTSTNFNRMITVRRCDFKQSYSPVYMNSIGVIGSLTVKDTNFNFTDSASLEITDTKLTLNGVTDITQLTEPSTAVFENCNFVGVKLQIGCNTTFINCEFGNMTSATDTQFNVQNGATITIRNSEGYKYSIPNSRYFPTGVFVRCTDTGEKGTSPNKYMILGWKRLTNGTSHVLNTDWRELRAFTGN